jgi:nitrogen-specific signal transduction histidine kinase
MAERSYFLGTHDEELERLGLQHRVWRPTVLECWRRAGIGPGSKVLDVGAGPGFAAADLPHVFEPLFRADRARGGAHAGLGLAIARRLVRAHGGEVRAANEASGGARLTIELPAA